MISLFLYCGNSSRHIGQVACYKEKKVSLILNTTLPLIDIEFAAIRNFTLSSTSTFFPLHCTKKGLYQEF